LTILAGRISVPNVRTGWRAAGVAATIALLTVSVAGAGARSPLVSAACNPLGKRVGQTIRFCGPATATLSVFSGVTFRNGTCRRTTANGNPALFIKLGTRSLRNPLQKGGTNGGLAYYDLSVIGPISQPVGGGVIAFWKGKHWYGRGVSFSGTSSRGSFVAQGIAARGSHGRATGSFRC
jgi:hypothetical protein